MQTPIVGTIVALSGNATQKVDGQVMQVELDGPVYKGAVLITEANSHLEVRFTDDTMLSQGQNSEISIDNYVFDADPNVASSILLNLTEGTLRTITGKIAEENPEKFEIKSPLTTLGIRGTDVVAESTESGDTYTLIKPGLNHFVVIFNLKGDRRYLNEPGQSITVNRNNDFDREVEILLDEKRKELLKAVPFSVTRQEDAEAESRSEEPDDDYVGDPSSGESGEDNIDQQSQDLEKAIESGDLSALDNLNTGAGGSLPAGAPGISFVKPLHLYDPVFTEYKGYSIHTSESSTDSDVELLFTSTQKALNPIIEAPPKAQPAQQESTPESGQPGAVQPIATLEILEEEPLAAPYSPLQLLFIGTDGDDIIYGNSANNIIFGAGGADTMYGRAGNDSFVVWGDFGADVYIGLDEAGNDLSGGSKFVVPHLADREIYGEGDYDTLIVYGDADFTEPQTVVTGIERIELHCEVSFRPDQFVDVQELVGIGSRNHTLIFKTPGEVDLSAIGIDNIDQIGLGDGVIAMVSADTMEALNNTDICPPDDSIVGDGSGYGTIITTAGTNFSDFITNYGDDIDPDIILGRAPTAHDDLVVATEDKATAPIDVLTNDDGNDEGDILALKSFSQGAIGCVSDNGDGTLTYTPKPGLYGSDSFTYTIIDSGGQTDTATVDITIYDDDPKVSQISYTDKNGQSQTATVDKNGTTIITLYGSLLIFQDGYYQYTPNQSEAALADITNSPKDPLALYAFDFGLDNDAYTNPDGTLNLSKADGTLFYDNNRGVGVEGENGGNRAKEINHTPDTDQSEALAIKFYAPVEKATVDVTWLFADEGPCHSSESGYWEAFDENGIFIEGGYINENTITLNQGNGSVTIDLGEDVLFETLVFTATHYKDSNNADKPDSSSDSSDYYVKNVDWVAPQEEFTVSLVDSEGNPLSDTILIVDENSTSGDIAPDPSDTQAATQSAAAPAVISFAVSQTMLAEDTPETPETTILQPQEQLAEVQSSQPANPAIQLFGGDEPATAAEAAVGDSTSSAESMSIAETQTTENSEPLFGDSTDVGETSQFILPSVETEPFIADTGLLQTEMDIVDAPMVTSADVAATEDSGDFGAMWIPDVEDADLPS